MEFITSDQFKENYAGPIGTPKRDALEQKIKLSILQEKIKQQRTQAALNQEQFAQQLEISKYQLSKIEKNIEQVNIGIIINVCQILEIPFNFEIETKKLQTA